MTDIEQMKKMIPFVMCEITFGRNVCELMFGVDVPDLNFRINIFCQTTNPKVLDTCLIVGLRHLIIILIKRLST